MINLDGGFMVENLTSIFLVEVIRTISNFIKRRFSLKIIGDKRTAVHRLTFFRNDNNMAFCIYAANTLNTSSGGYTIADNYILFHGLTSLHIQLPCLDSP